MTWKQNRNYFCGFPLVSCEMCMSERMCALINLIWDLWRKRHSLARALPNIHHLIICFHPSVQSNLADQHSSFTLRIRSHRNKQLRRSFRKLHSNLAPVSVPLTRQKLLSSSSQLLWNTRCVLYAQLPKASDALHGLRLLTRAISIRNNRCQPSPPPQGSRSEHSLFLKKAQSAQDERGTLHSCLLYFYHRDNHWWTSTLSRFVPAAPECERESRNKFWQHVWGGLKPRRRLRSTSRLKYWNSYAYRVNTAN